MQLGAKYILFSSIEADGTFSGPDIYQIKRIVNNLPSTYIYAAGGIRRVEDLKNLKQIGVHGVIIRKAFYENKIPPYIANRKF